VSKPCDLVNIGWAKRAIALCRRQAPADSFSNLTTGHDDLIPRPGRRSSRRWLRPSSPPWSMGATTPGHDHATHPGTTRDGGLYALRPPPVDLVELRPHLGNQ